MRRARDIIKIDLANLQLEMPQQIIINWNGCIYVPESLRYIY